MNFKKDTIVYSVSRDIGTNRFSLLKTKVGDTEITYTPKGRPRTPIVRGIAINYSVNGRSDVTIIEGVHFTSAVNAVKNALGCLFNNYSPKEEAEQRILRAIFGEPAVNIKIEDLASTIGDLKDLHNILVEAVRIDNDNIQKDEQKEMKNEY